MIRRAEPSFVSAQTTIQQRPVESENTGQPFEGTSPHFPAQNNLVAASTALQADEVTTRQPEQTQQFSLHSGFTTTPVPHMSTQPQPRHENKGKERVETCGWCKGPHATLACDVHCIGCGSSSHRILDCPVSVCVVCFPKYRAADDSSAAGAKLHVNTECKLGG
ncbi:hypothetical protein CcaCcLH18_12291 [Colletotrichum camelliae]|nr:hypothetical protein CcaCcLH18_12291 [Colletotrichum camelliae]